MLPLHQASLARYPILRRPPKNQSNIALCYCVCHRGLYTDPSHLRALQKRVHLDQGEGQRNVSMHGRVTH